MRQEKGGDREEIKRAWMARDHGRCGAKGQLHAGSRMKNCVGRQTYDIQWLKHNNNNNNNAIDISPSQLFCEPLEELCETIGTRIWHILPALTANVHCSTKRCFHALGLVRALLSGLSGLLDI